MVELSKTLRWNIFLQKRIQIFSKWGHKPPSNFWIFFRDKTEIKEKWSIGRGGCPFEIFLPQRNQNVKQLMILFYNNTMSGVVELK